MQERLSGVEGGLLRASDATRLTSATSPVTAVLAARLLAFFLAIRGILAGENHRKIHITSRLPADLTPKAGALRAKFRAPTALLFVI
jgi:hypothetical protein